MKTALTFISIFISFLFISNHLNAAEQNIVEVYGIADIEAPADLWNINLELSVVETDKTSANTKYNQVSRNFKNALDALNLKYTSESSPVSSSELSGKEKESKKGKLWQITLTQTLRFEDFASASKALASITKLENVNINYIEYSLNDASKKKITEELYSSAHKDAMAKIEILLKSMDKKFQKITYTGEDMNNPQNSFNHIEAIEKKASPAIKSIKIPLHLKINVQASYL